MEREVEAANSERSEAAMAAKRRSLHDSRSSQLVMADRWSREEIRPLLLKLKDVMFDKNMDEHRLMKGRKMRVEREEAEPDSDDKRVFSFRRRWIAEWSGNCGSLESVTEITSMPFTNQRAPPCAYPCNTLQIYSVSVSGLSEGLQWPLDVFGMITVRDSADHNLNIAYYRTSDACQTLTEKDTYLTLTGPSRAVVLDLDSNMVMIEVELKVKGENESEDKYLSFLAQPVTFITGLSGPSLFNYRSKNSSLSFMLSNIAASVEATIFIRVIEGSWPVGVSGDITVTVEDENVYLLEFGADEVPVGGDGDVELSRRVVSVGVDNVLDVCCYGRTLGEQFVIFKVAEAGRSYATLLLGTCKLEVLAVWSVVSPELGGTSLWCC